MNDSTPVYTTATGVAPKSALARTLKVVTNEPVEKIIRPRVKKHAPAVPQRTRRSVNLHQRWTLRSLGRRLSNWLVVT